MPIKDEYTCAKCGVEKNGTIDQKTSVYLYRGAGKGNRKTGNDVVCTECTTKLLEGWKYPISLN